MCDGTRTRFTDSHVVAVFQCNYRVLDVWCGTTDDSRLGSNERSSIRRHKGSAALDLVDESSESTHGFDHRLDNRHEAAYQVELSVARLDS